jgi:hypothetical protein
MKDNLSISAIILVAALVITSCTSSSTGTRQIPPEPSVSGIPNGPGVTTPEAGTGSVEGRLISSSSDLPLQGQTVYLGDFLPLDPGDEYLVTLEVEGSPNTRTDETGLFIFSGISPGNYPLLIWTPFKSMVIPDHTNDKELIVVVLEGQTTQIGDLVVDWP